MVDYFDDGEIFNGSVHWGWYLGATLLGAAVGAGVGMAISYYATGSVTASTGKVLSGLFGKSTYYRTMSADDYTQLHSSGKLNATDETFITPDASYAQMYNGTTVRFSVRNRVVFHLEKIGVRNSAKLFPAKYSGMPLVKKGWGASRAFFKFERGIVNIGLGHGKALTIFNKSIVWFNLL